MQRLLGFVVVSEYYADISIYYIVCALYTTASKYFKTHGH